MEFGKDHDAAIGMHKEFDPVARLQVEMVADGFWNGAWPLMRGGFHGFLYIL